MSNRIPKAAKQDLLKQIDSWIEQEGDRLLEKAIDWIKTNLSPEDVFDESDLDNWATESGAGERIAFSQPSVKFKPHLSQDGDMWIALYGDNLQTGVVGIGESPSEAMYHFDIEWNKRVER